MKCRTAARSSTLAGSLVAVLLAVATLSLPVWGQTSPARGSLQRPAANADEMPLDDYLALLQQIAPAAETGARAYLAAFQQRCRRPMRTSELRQAMSEGDGDPVLMGLIRTSQQQDAAAQVQWARQLRCPGGSTR